MSRLLAIFVLLGHTAFAGTAEPGIEPSAAAAEGSAESANTPAKAAAANRAAHPLDGIMATTDDRGRIVYVNAPPPAPEKPEASAPRRTSNLVYWSNKEQQWKPVPPPTPSAMRAARNAAAEVMDYVQEKSVTRVSARRQAKAAPPAVSIPSPAEHRKSYNTEVLAELHHDAPAAADHRPAAAAQSGNAHARRWSAATAYVVSTKEIDEAIERAAARHRVDPNLVRAMIKVESNFNPRAVSKKGAMGLMQLMPATARSLDVSHPFDPEENVDAGVRHLKTLLDNYGGNVRLSLAAYNAGQTAVARYNGVPAIPETTNYVKQITALYSNGGPASLFLGFTSRKGQTPVRVFRNNNGVITMTNE